MVIKRRPKLTLNTAIVRKNPSPLKIPNLNSAVSLARDERINSSRNILTVLEGGKTYTKPIKILPNLYLGSCDATKDLSILLDKDISTILNLAAEVERPKWFSTDHWMGLSNNHWVTKITQDQLETMSYSSEASSNATRVNNNSFSLTSPPSPSLSDDEDTTRKSTTTTPTTTTTTHTNNINNINNTIPSKETSTIFPLSPLPQRTYPTLQNLNLYNSQQDSIPLSPSSPVTPTSYGSSSQHTIILSPIDNSFPDSVSSMNTLSTPFVDSYSYTMPPETPFMDTISTPYVPETPYVDAFRTPMTTSPNQLPPETPYYDTYNNNNNSSSNNDNNSVVSATTTPAVSIPETPYMDAYSSQQQQFLAKIISHSNKSIHDSNLLQAISLSSASTPPSATLGGFPTSLSSKCHSNSRLGLVQSARSPMNDNNNNNNNKELEIHYYHQCWNHNQRNTQEKLQEAFNIIDSTRLGDKHSILVSCQQGVSRSATLVIAYVMKTKQWGLMKSYNFVKEKCPWIAPNITLMNELSEFEQHLLHESQK
ncbi:phosphatases II [Neocallimastix lanati (nom. inval.)]|nr:phosphatases II [Neocallimastix sp. JGI-2020a]